MKTTQKILSVLFVLIAFHAQAQDKYTLVFLHKRTDASTLSKEESDKIMEGHFANIQKMHKDGHLIAAGPFEGGGGIFIFKKGSFKDIEEWMSVDPGVKAKRWNIEMLKYEPVIGGICDAPEPYEMVMYNFIHFKPKLYKFNVQESGQTVDKHVTFIKDLSKGGNVITLGTFGEADGGILVMKGELQQEVILQDPAVTEALFEPEFKKLYIAKGAFCEK